MRRPVSTVLLAFLALGASACDSHVFDRLRPTPRTAHERYAEALRDAGLDSTALGQEWLAASDSALRAPLTAVLPLRETGVYTRNEARAVAYRMPLRDGERVRATLRADGMQARLYLDLFEVSTDTSGDPSTAFRHRATADTLPRADSSAALLELVYEARRSGDVVIRLQPELLREGRFTLVIRTEPVLAFPVEGGSNRSIGSYYGVDRDGGRRSHQGIDIFAARGTPALAATDGVVRSIASNELGGLVVWLSDPSRAQTLYYAHLDRQVVQAGQRVRVGDTLGFVGNTGNARTTPPHLHFGIYRRGAGAIDPLYHVRQTAGPPEADVLNLNALGQVVAVRAEGVDLYAAPRTTSTRVARIARGANWQVMAANGEWYRVQSPDGHTGYLRQASVSATTRRPRGTSRDTEATTVDGIRERG